MRIAALIAAVVLLAAPAAGEAAVWHGHTVKVRFTGQIDASPCPEPSCLRGIVTTYYDGMDVRDRVVRCAWPHPRILAFTHYGYRAWVKVHVCGRNRWWRFR